MNANEWKGNWHIIKGRLMQQCGGLTENDLKYEAGKEEELIGRLQKRLGLTEVQVLKLINR